MTRIFSPPHPGETLCEDVLLELRLTVTEAAERLGVTRSAPSRIQNALRQSRPQWHYVWSNGRASKMAGEPTYGPPNKPTRPLASSPGRCVVS